VNSLPLRIINFSRFEKGTEKKMKRPLAFITAAWSGNQEKDTKLATNYCRSVYELGFSPICPVLYLPLFTNSDVPQEHKDSIDMSRELLRRSHVLVVCGERVNEPMKSDIAIAKRLHITATTLSGLLTVKDCGHTKTL
jgi:hypothetical protein